MKGKTEAFISTLTEGGTIPIPSDVKTRLEITNGDYVEVRIEKLNRDRLSMHRFYTPGRTTPVSVPKIRKSQKSLGRSPKMLTRRKDDNESR